MEDLFERYLVTPMDELVNIYGLKPKTIKYKVNKQRKDNLEQLSSLEELRELVDKVDFKKYFFNYSSQVPIRLFDNEYDLHQLYTVDLMSKSEIVKLINIPGVTTEHLSTYIEKQRYTLTEEDRAKYILTHTSETKKQRYGDPHYNNPEKLRKTSLERYGVEHPGALKSAHKAQRDTMRARYGTEHAINVPEFRKKMNNAMQERYGAEWYGASDKGREVLSYREPVMTFTPTELVQTKERAIELFRNPEELTKFIDITFGENKVTIDELSEKLGIPRTSLLANSPAYAVVKHQHVLKSSGSKPQEEIYNFIKENYIGDVLYNSRPKELDGLELDIYIPDYNLAIEFNGSYWHDEKHRSKNYHKYKLELADKAGIYLMYIWDYDWINPIKQAIIKSQLLNKLGKSTRVYARKTTLKEVSYQEAKQFEEINHLQGFAAHKVAYGLYTGDTLVALMTFGKSRYNHNYQYELIRFVTKQRYTVVGGASKLFNHFVKQYGRSVMSYANRDFSKEHNSLYETLGMTLIGTTSPGYVWYKPNHPILSRYKTQANKLREQYEDFTGTETAYMYSKGYTKLYNSGNNVYGLEIK